MVANLGSSLKQNNTCVLLKPGAFINRLHYDLHRWLIYSQRMPIGMCEICSKDKYSTNVFIDGFVQK